MISAVAPLVRGSTYRRGIYLLLAVVFAQTLTIPRPATPAGCRCRCGSRCWVAA